MPNEFKTDKTAAASPSPLSLVRYCEPSVVLDAVEKQKMAKANAAQSGEMDKEMKMPSSGGASGLLQQKDEQNDIGELLNAILPPRYWEANGKLWEQIVSPLPATREDVVRLQDVMDTRLAKTQARGSGLCMVRHGIYAECFDEIIRQATINCSERGLLLLRIRDEMKMSIDACEVLYGNAVEFGLRKAIQAAKEKEELSNRIKNLAAAHVTIQKSLEDTKQHFEEIQSRTAELYAAEELRFAEELAFVKKCNAQLKSQLEAINAAKK